MTIATATVSESPGHVDEVHRLTAGALFDFFFKSHVEHVPAAMALEEIAMKMNVSTVDVQTPAINHEAGCFETGFLNQA